MEDVSFPRGGRHNQSKKASEEAELSKQNSSRPSHHKRKKNDEGTSNNNNSTSTSTSNVVKQDFLFGSTATADADRKSGKKKKRKTMEDASIFSSGKHSLLPLGGGGVIVSSSSSSSSKNNSKDALPSSSKEPSSTTSILIEAFGFSKLAKGTKVLGVVREVQDEFAVVSLPNLLTGYMLMEAGSGSGSGNGGDGTSSSNGRSLKHCVSIGQTLSVIVQKVVTEQVKGNSSARRRIQVSALPKHVNPREEMDNINSSQSNQMGIRGQIISVEDHGFLMDLGYGRKGFCKFEDIQGDYQVLEEDEDEDDIDIENDNDNDNDVVMGEEKKAEEKVVNGKSKASKSTPTRILQPGRLYNVLVTPNSSSSKDNKTTSSAQVYSLSLPSTQTLAKQVVTPPVVLTRGPRNAPLPTSSVSGSVTLASLTPGWLVHAKVEAVAKNGLCISFLGGVFRGSIELGHVGGHFVPSTREGNDSMWRRIFETQQHFQARIVAVDVATKLIRLSLLPHVLDLKAPTTALEQGFPDIGTIVQDCTVVRVDPGIGVLLALPEDADAESNLSRRITKSDLYQHNEPYQQALTRKAVYVHISKALEERDDTIKGLLQKEFAPSTRHDVRILSCGNWMDGIASGACAPSILKAHVLTHADLKPGQVYRQVPVCAQLNGGSILVQLGGGANNIRGLIPANHLFETSSSSEYRNKLLKAKYAVDARIDIRVLDVQVSKKKCLVTAKKSLVKANESEIIQNYKDIKVGQKATGFVSKIDDKALYVTFCNRVYAKVTARSLAAELGMEDHKDNYKVGDVVTGRVVKLKKRTKQSKSSPFADEQEEEVEEEEDNDGEEQQEEQATRAYYDLYLSLKVEEGDEDAHMLDDANNDDIEAERNIQQHPKQVRIRAGAILPLKSMKIVELVKGKRKEKGGFVPGYAIVSIKSKYLIAPTKDSQKDNADVAMLPYMECKLPYDQITDDYHSEDIATVEALDEMAERVLTVGKKINQKGIILTDPRKSNVDYSSGIGKFTVVSIRKTLIATAEKQYSSKETSPEDIILPDPESSLFVGALVQGYVAQVDRRHGAFIRFLDGMTGLIPRMNGGLDLPLYNTIVAKVQVIDDTVRPFRIMLQTVSGGVRAAVDLSSFPLKAGDKIQKAKITKVDFVETFVDILDEKLQSQKFQAVIHNSMKEAAAFPVKFRNRKGKNKNANKGNKKPIITDCHPFFGMKVAQVMKHLTVVSVDSYKGNVRVHLTDRKVVEGNDTAAPTLIKTKSQLKPGMIAYAVTTSQGNGNKGIFVSVSPSVKAFVPGLEVSTEMGVLSDLHTQVPPGRRIKCRVLDAAKWHENQAKGPFRPNRKGQDRKNGQLLLSVLAVEEDRSQFPKPVRGDVVIGIIGKHLPAVHAPSLMMTLRGGFLGRCCITELEEADDWENMPLGRMTEATPVKAKQQKKDKDGMNVDEDSDDESEEAQKDEEVDESFPDGKYVRCRVLKALPKQSVVDVSLRATRKEGDLEDDETPPVGETVQGFVIQTNKKGCFVRLSRNIEGHVTLKELCDGFLPDPEKSFPMGRLVVGKVSEVRDAPKKGKRSKDSVKVHVDLDMRESILLEHKQKLSFEEIEIESKHKGTVTRVESYGVFVQIENSNVSGLVHMSECSDKFIKNLQALYDPGDLVKIIVLKKDEEAKRVGFSMKASHFEDDEDSDDDSSDDDSSDGDEEMVDMEAAMNGGDDLDSDDENFATKLAAKMQAEEGDDSDGDSEDDEEGGDSDGESDDDRDSKDEGKTKKSDLDTDVGFDWGATTGKKTADGDSSDESDSESEDDDDDDQGKTSSHKSRKKQALRRREEQEITRRETALADGTADENPETAGDFERMLSGNPNSSELWIKYMAFYLSLADIPSARAVADKALGRIEFRQEQEKLNVWTALLTLEHKYGSFESLQKTIDRACGQNNPKHVYLRACEILEKDQSSPQASSKASDMFVKMCKKFRSKKQVWLAHLQFLLKQSRHQEAHALLKRALMSLPSYKHAETMSKFAQLEFEFGSPERARTVFDGIILKYSKRLDLFFVYLDKEVKFGKMTTARALLEHKVEERKLSDKQMKSLFKKWYRIEEQHGTEETREHVKNSARNYVQQTTD